MERPFENLGDEQLKRHYDTMKNVERPHDYLAHYALMNALEIELLYRHQEAIQDANLTGEVDDE